MLSYTQKRELKANQRRILVDSLNIQLASPSQIKSWAERLLPTGALVGQVTNSKTLDYKNHKPLKDGLFCERIFGPVKDFVCACGKQKPKDGTRYCLQCGVEFTHSRVRRLRLGYIQLASSVTHIWFLKGRPSYLSLLLGKKKRLVVAIAYCNAFFVEQDFPVTRYVLKSSLSKIPIPIDRPIYTKKTIISPIKKSDDVMFPTLASANYVQKHIGEIDMKNVFDRPTIFTNQRFVSQKTKDFKNNPVKELRKGSFTGFYSQAQTLPFLPSFATTYFTRTALVNYLFLSPKKEDILLHFYCQATRWEPLVDIHDFMAEQPLQTFNHWSWLSEKEGDTTLRNKTQSIHLFPERAELAAREKPKAVLQTEKEAFHKWIGPLSLDVLEGKAVASEIEDTDLKPLNLTSDGLVINDDEYLPLAKTRDLRSEEAVSHTDKAAIDEILSYTGGGALKTLLQRFDMALVTSFLASDLQDIYSALRIFLKNRKQTRVHATLTKLLKRLLRRRAKTSRRLKLAKLFFQTKRKPEWMMLSVLPVLPPKLRPIERRDGLSYTSDLNRLYQMVLNRNRRFQKLIVVDISTVTATQRLLQDAVDGLLENGKGGSKPFSHPNGQPLISLSDKLKGKRGRFRLNLLGKRVDYSGRSVIVVEPKLKVHECGLPEEMALELFSFLFNKAASCQGSGFKHYYGKEIAKAAPSFYLENSSRTYKSSPNLAQ